MILSKEKLMLASDKIQPNPIRNINAIKIEENWGFSYTIEVTRTEKKNTNITDFILSSFISFDEGEYIEDKDELVNLINSMEFKEVEDPQSEQINKKTRNRLNFLFEEIGKITGSTELFYEWNKYSVIIETENDYLLIFSNTPE